MIPSFDASPSAAELVPLDVVRHVHRVLAAEGRRYVVIGAAARDLAVHGPAGTPVRRVTKDVDVAVAVGAGSGHQLLRERLGQPTSAAQRVRVLGVDVDVIPIAGDAAHVTLGETILDLGGLAEAVRHPTMVRVASDLVVPVAPIQAQAALKVVAWSDRQPGTHKDAGDLGQILEASSNGVFEELAWNDDDAVAAWDGDVRLMGPWRLGRAARELLSSRSLAAVIAVLDAQRPALSLRLAVPEGPEMLDAFCRGLSA
ncbi:MAG: hypothetical protein ACRCY8_11285 [Dermatophilaceae bacterium]